MEVSSHALVFGRVDGVTYDVSLFNNLTPEHLDFHPDMEDYFQAKARLFAPGKSRLGVVNLDDAYGRRLAAEARIPVTSFSAKGAAGADWRAVDVQLGPVGSTFRVLGPDGAAADASVPLPGPFNVANALAAITVLVTAGLPLDRAVAGVAAVPGVPGRLERVDAGQPFVAVVDYAHKPDALQAVLESLREVTKGRLHVVVGCGGDRDPHKRAPMGAIAARLADTAVLTSDNPRSEDALAILATMLTGAAGVPEAERGAVLVVPDRAEAIADAVARAHAGDTVLVAGKGHEPGQYVRDEIRPFDDREVLRDVISRSSAARGTRGVEQP
jgi:UDP-N-acetylmuramoyl-L-alanyl-D-glutamate--2,6-diaminopimelate ligase